MTVDDLQTRLMSDLFSGKGSSKKAAGRALGVIQEVIVHYLLRQMGLSKSIFLEGRLPEYNPTRPALTHNSEFTIHEVVRTEPVKLEKTSWRGEDASRYLRNIPFLEDDVSEKLAERMHEGGVRLFTVAVGKKSELDFRKEGTFRVAEWIAHESGEVRFLKLRPSAFIECKRVGLEEGTTSGPQTIEKAKQAAYVAGHASSVQGLRGPLDKRGAYYDSDSENWVFKPYEEIWQSIIDGEIEVEHAIRSVIFVGDHMNWYPSNEISKDLQVIIDNHDWTIWVEDKALVQFSEEFLFDEDSHVGQAFRKHHSDDRPSSVRYFSKQSLWEPAHNELYDYFEENMSSIVDEWFNVLDRDQTVLDLGDELVKLST